MESNLSINLIVDESQLRPRATSQCQYDEETDDVGTILADVCDLLAETGAVAFAVRGFSDEAWPTDVATDLTTVLEQLPACIRALMKGEDATLEFYEQGIERTLSFDGAAPTVLVTCSSRHPEWRPDVASLRLQRDYLVQMLQRLAHDFYSYAHRVCPELADHPWMRAWMLDISAGQYPVE